MTFSGIFHFSNIKSGFLVTNKKALRIYRNQTIVYRLYDRLLWLTKNMIREITSRWYYMLLRGRTQKDLYRVTLLLYLKFFNLFKREYGNEGSKKHFTNFTVGTCYRKLHLLTEFCGPKQSFCKTL